MLASLEVKDIDIASLDNLETAIQLMLKNQTKADHLPNQTSQLLLSLGPFLKTQFWLPAIDNEAKNNKDRSKANAI